MRDARQLLATWRTLSVTPGGKQLFSRLICFETPWAAGVRPMIESVQPGQIEITMRKQRRLLDRDGNIHLMAQGTLAELAAHTAARVTVAASDECRTAAAQIRLLQPAVTTLTATARGPITTAQTNADEYEMQVDIRDTAGTLIGQAQVTLQITPSARPAPLRTYTPEGMPPAGSSTMGLSTSTTLALHYRARKAECKSPPGT